MKKILLICLCSLFLFWGNVYWNPPVYEPIIQTQTWDEEVKINTLKEEYKKATKEKPKTTKERINDINTQIKTKKKSLNEAYKKVNKAETSVESAKKNVADAKKALEILNKNQTTLENIGTYVWIKTEAVIKAENNIKEKQAALTKEQAALTKEQAALTKEQKTLNTDTNYQLLLANKNKLTSQLQAENINVMEEINASQTFDVNIIWIWKKTPKSFAELAKKVVSFLSVMVSSIAMLAIMIWGIMMMISAGDENLSGKGKTIIIAAIGAILLVLGSYVIVTAVQQILYALGK